MSSPLPAEPQDDLEPVLHLPTLVVLGESVGEDVVGDLIAAGVADMRENVRRLQAAAPDEMRAVAHDLKSAAGSFGALRLQARARVVEIACREGRVDDAVASLPEIRRAAEEAFAALDARHDTAPAEAR